MYWRCPIERINICRLDFYQTYCLRNILRKLCETLFACPDVMVTKTPKDQATVDKEG